MSSHSNHGAIAAKAGTAAASAGLGKKILHTAIKHPLILFGLGIAAGVALYRYQQQNDDPESCCKE